MAGAGDRKTPKLPAFLVEARERKTSKQPVYERIPFDPLLGGDDLYMRVGCFLIGCFCLVLAAAIAYGTLAGEQPPSEIVAGVLLAVAATAYGLLQVSRCMLPAETPMARRAERWAPPFLRESGWGGVVFFVVVVVIILGLRLLGVRGQRSVSREITPMTD